MTAEKTTSNATQERAVALQVEDVSLQYRGRRGTAGHRALDGVTLIIYEGERISLLGPNGSGKTTLFRAICGLLRPDRGRIRVFGDQDRRKSLQHLGVVFQTDSLDPHFTVRENLRDHARLYGLEGATMDRRIREALDDAGLADRADELVKRLSGGLMRRADLSRALLPQPRLLLLDEPTVGLDPAARERFLRAIEDAQQRHAVTILMSTHLVDEADRADRVIFMHNGRAIADDAPAALRRQVGSALLTVLDSRWQPPENDDWRLVAGSWRRTIQYKNDDATAAIATRLIKDGVPFTIAPPTLADVFAQLTGTSLEASLDPATKMSSTAIPEPIN